MAQNDRRPDFHGGIQGEGPKPHGNGEEWNEEGVAEWEDPWIDLGGEG